MRGAGGDRETAYSRTCVIVVGEGVQRFFTYINSRGLNATHIGYIILFYLRIPIFVCFSRGWFKLRVVVFFTHYIICLRSRVILGDDNEYLVQV